jgi:hypothetical protein
VSSLHESGRWAREAVSPRAFARHRLPRSSPNHRPFRRTRKSVRPAPAAESQIEPWFAPRDPGAWIRQGDSGDGEREKTLMRKKQANRKTSRRRVLRISRTTGLIADAKTLKQSAGTKSGLDTRSHRTPELACRRIHKMQRRSRCFHSSPVWLNDC